MATLYQRNMNILDNTKIENIFDTVSKSFIPLDQRSPFYQKVLSYCDQQGITINDLDLFVI